MSEYEKLRRFMARRSWDVLAAEYGVSRWRLLNAVREGRRHASLSPDQWEDIMNYRAEWHKANDRMREIRSGFKP